VALDIAAREITRTGAAGPVREAAGAAATSGRHARLGVRRIVWSTTPAGPYASITFDDGPTPEFTPRILAALHKAGVKATFSVMGHNAATHPGLVRDIVAAGHEIANHTWTHLDQTQITASQIREEILRCKDEVERLIQQPLVGFRPPRGELAGYATMVAGELGYDVFMWSCTRGPGGTSTPAAVAHWLGTTVGPGDVIDLHDGIGRGTFDPAARFARDLAARREMEVRALPEALQRIADRGVLLTTVTDLLARSAPEPLPTWKAPVTTP
jgi:peptidoglycan/xylan/chitin deacetylase (PgdA/CDA1 family)